MKKRFFEAAKDESHLSDYHGQHLGAVAVYKDKFILARAHNTSKTNPTQYYYNRYRAQEKSNIMSKPPRSHAEIDLFRRIRYLNIDFKHVTVYIYRELKNGQMAIAKPCKACEQCLRDLGIVKICYTDYDGVVEKRYTR